MESQEVVATPDPEEAESSNGSEPPGFAHPIVGIGASAGGLAAAEAFFREIPTQPGMAFILVQHLAPDHTSEMAELLQNHTDLTVTQAEDGQKVEVDRVYCIPPGQSLTLDGETLRLAPGEGRRGHVRTPIDTFFHSLATAAGESAVCIILSGTGTDGTLGLKAVKEAGGVIFAQHPADAEYDGMPRSAVGTGMVDVVGSPAELAQRLMEFRRSAREIRIPDVPEELPSDGSAALSRIFALLRAETGHDFSHYKRSSILRRINRRLQVLSIPDIPEYLGHLRHNPDEAQALFRDFLISVTRFFRDPEVWRLVESDVIPALFEGKAARDTVRVWVPGCATGEEAYSIAMLLCEHAAGLDQAPAIQVFGTDIDQEAVAFAREGEYAESVVSDVSRERLRRFFHETGSGWRVRRELRQIILFAPHDLIADPPFSRLDLISCRNLLIYLNAEIQESVYGLFHYALRDDGYLLLGSSESADSADQLFKTISKRERIYRSRSVQRAHPPRFPTVALGDGDEHRHGGRRGARRGQSLADRFGERLLRERVPPTVLVDREYDVCHVAGGAGEFLRHADGAPSHSILDMVTPELRLGLRAALYQALQKRDRVDTRPVPVDLPDGQALVSLEVVPVPEEELGGRFAEVIFHRTEATTPVGDRAAPEDAELASHLEQELDETRERLQTVIEEYETSNEELQASNEELQSMNEELRSTTEELETGREELQSMNEELITVNQELRTKIEQLGRSNSDLQNLMAVTDVGAVFLDRNLRITRFTPRAADVVHLQAADIGRPFEALASRLNGIDLPSLAAEVLRDLGPIERQATGEDGREYDVRLRPYRSVDDAIEGVVLTFFDVTSIKESEREALRQRQYLDVALSPAPLFAAIQDTDLRYTFVRGAHAEYASAGIIGKTDAELLPPDEAEVVTALKRSVLESGEPVQSEITASGPNGDRTYAVHIDAIRDEEGAIEGIAVAAMDISQRIETERELRAARNAALAAADSKSKFLAAMSHELRTPLNAIGVYLDLLQASASDALTDNQTDRIRKIRKSARHLLHLIDNILGHARLDAGAEEADIGDVHMSEVLDEVTTVIAPLAQEKGLDFRTHAPDPLPTVRTDARKIRQILLNLLGNAVKFTDEGSVLLTLEEAPGRLLIRVTDTGPGIDAEEMRHIFDPFWQADGTLTRTQGGAGLGLTLCRQYADLLGLGLTATSTPGAGSVFEVEVPVEPPASQNRAESDSSA